jgi:cytochrome c-type biogenesis protein CcmH
MKRLALFVMLALAGQAFAIDADTPIADPQQRAVYERLTHEVRCLVCQNQTIADSTAPLAADLRREIRAMVESGQTESQVKDFLTDRYGDFVLYKPRYTGNTAVLWAAPLLLLIGGAIWLLRIVRRRAALPVSSEEQDAF